MEPKLGEKYLITTNNWFIAPDGDQYRGVFGTIHAILNDEEALGIKTNRHSSNWYVHIGNMFIGGCQIHYAIRTDSVSIVPPNRQIEHKGELKDAREDNSRIYMAD